MHSLSLDVRPGKVIDLIDAARLLRQMGVVLQENLIFNRSVGENIAITDPAAPFPTVMRATQMAGANEFASEMPEGYDTIVGEQGTSLSGGQRQRIAIARALFTNRRIRIFDEAISALDYESEPIVLRSMASICKGRTMIVIGYEVLLRKPEGLYATLWAMQAGTGTSSSQCPR